MPTPHSLYRRRGTVLNFLEVGRQPKQKTADLKYCRANRFDLSFVPCASAGIAHLRPRTNAIGAVARVRSTLAQSTHRFFSEKGFVYVHTPILTASDCEGAGEMFQVTTLPVDKPDTIARTEDGAVDYKQDFFEKPTFLTVSGQLAAETYATSLSDVYTFGPTFRAENSNTTRHLAEFWMIEPEMAFADLYDDMANAEAYVR